VVSPLVFVEPLPSTAQWLSTLDTANEHNFRRDLGSAHETIMQGVSPGRASSAAGAWALWVDFTSDLGLDPFLQAFQDKIPFLQVFAQRLRSGELAPKGNPIRARTVEDYLRHVAQTYLRVGALDPRLSANHAIDFRLTRTWRAWKSADPAPTRVKPVPITVIRRIATLALTTRAADPFFIAVADMIIIAFFFLLRPGEYTDNTNDPF